MLLLVWTSENIGALDMSYLQKGNHFIDLSGWFMFIPFDLLKTELLILSLDDGVLIFPLFLLSILKWTKMGKVSS